MENLKYNLFPIIKDFFPEITSIDELIRLSGGSSNESWKISIKHPNGIKNIVFRRTPDGNEKDGDNNNFVGITNEAKVMDVAKSYNVPVPKIYKIIDDKNLGKGFFMEFIEGETLGVRIVNNDEFKSIRLYTYFFEIISITTNRKNIRNFFTYCKEMTLLQRLQISLLINLS